MSYILCQHCRGSKKSSKLGGILKDCEPCKGIGYVEEIKEDVKIDSMSDTESTPVVESLADKIKKKRGRKPFKEIAKQAD